MSSNSKKPRRGLTPPPPVHINRRDALSIGTLGAAGALGLPVYGAAAGEGPPPGYDVLSVKDFGAIGDGASDDTRAIQATVDAAIETGNSVFVPGGSYRVSRPIDLRNSVPVTNSGTFGITIRGIGMGSAILGTQRDRPLFEMDAGPDTDLQVFLSDLALFDRTSGTKTAFNVGRLRRYSSFERIRLYGFREGFRFKRPIWGLDLRNLFIRGCRGPAMITDESSLDGGVVTEMRWFGGYVDNNGAGVASGANPVGALDLFNCQEAKFYGVVFEGNYGGGLRLRGASENCLFSGCRFEETYQRFGAGGHIHSLANSTRNVHFQSCEFAYHKRGRDGDKNYQLVYAGARPTTFANCQFVEVSNENPTDMFGATPPDADVWVRDSITGIGSSYHLRVPARYTGARVGNASHASGGGPPTTGQWLRGDTVFNSAPSNGATFSWVCVVSGSPGRWAPTGRVGT